MIKEMFRYLQSSIVLMLLFTHPVAAQSIAVDKPEKEQLAIQEYLGVAPGVDNPPAMGASPGCLPIHATWLGFQLLPDGGSRFFVQLTSRVPIHIEDSHPKKIQVTLKDVKVAGRNNRRPLQTYAFDTPVTKAYLIQQKHDTVIVFEMDEKTLPTVTEKPGTGGYHFVLFDFPKEESGSQETMSSNEVTSSGSVPQQRDTQERTNSTVHIESSHSASFKGGIKTSNKKKSGKTKTKATAGFSFGK